MALALDPLQHLPARKGEPEAVGELAGVSRDRIDMLVVRREGGQHVVGLVGERAQRRNEAVLVFERIGSEARLGVPGAEAEGVRPVVECEDAQPAPPERADRRQAVHPGHFHDDRGPLPRHPRESSYAPEEGA